MSDPPKTGDVYNADLRIPKGSEPGFSRPVVIFQAPELAHFTSTFVCIPLTTNTKRLGIPGTCFVGRGDGGLAADSVALCYQLHAVDRTRLRERLGRLDDATVQALADALLNALGIDVESEGSQPG